MLRDRFSAPVAALLASDEWLIVQDHYNPRENLDWESRFCLTSGYMSSRGSEICGTSQPSLPATYVHGVFDRSEAFAREMVNVPDWAKLKVYVRCVPLGVADEGTTDYLRVLDMQNGLVASHYIADAGVDGRVLVETVKLLSRVHPQCGIIRLYLTPLDQDTLFEMENIIDGTVTNFMDYPRFRARHFEITAKKQDKQGIYMEAVTRDFRLPLGIGTCVEGEGIAHRAFMPYGETACEFFDARVKKGQTLRIDKFAALSTGRDTEGVGWQVKRLLEEITTRGADMAIAKHREAYRQLWAMADLEIDGDDQMQKAMRFNIFHLMSTPSPTDDRVNIGAKLMHGEEYSGHAFWDTELFCLPFFTWVFPGTARNLVRYRGHLLEAARKNARDNGYRGAKYPWESADTGDEECPAWTVEYDGTCYRCHIAEYEHHVTAAVAYGLDQYVRITGDEALMEEFGLELLLETARFWVSRMVWNSDQKRYEILQVTGPDEWHEPVNNNAYTNRMAKWNIEAAMSALLKMRKSKPDRALSIQRRIRLSDAEIADWQHHADHIYLHGETGLIEQFDGYFDIPDAVITAWDEHGMPIMPDVFAGKHGMQRSILKQADVVMLMKVLSNCYDPDTQRINFEYYEKRTLHRSSLSPSVHAQISARLNLAEHAYQYLERSAYVDLDNNQRNTREGLHAASMGGTWQAVVMGFCGLHLNEQNELAFQPHFPPQWKQVRFRLQWHGKQLQITVKSDQAEIKEII